MNNIKHPTASLTRRFFSLLYESLLVCAISLIALLVTIPFSLTMGSDNIVVRMIALIILLTAWACYFRITWLKVGQTLPMKVWSIRIENLNGQLISSTQAWARFFWAVLFLAIIPAFSYYAMRFYYPPKIAFYGSLLWWILPWGYAFFDVDKQFLYDKLSGSRTVLHKKEKKS
ncbi:RDD family protein [Neisseria sp. Ec49-e6-T10]|uniref:RDD family protein n=1 Tax=Neisseria sp. Ec49-e6-T10 TaxID=3140744 RepID=UPI003EBB3ABE